jgi:hypothetical protein
MVNLDDPDGRRAWYENAYGAAIRQDTPANRAEYTRAYQEAHRRRECMICAQPMQRPTGHSLMRDDQTRAGPEFLAHEECFVRVHQQNAWRVVKEDPVGVDDRGTIITNTTFERE